MINYKRVSASVYAKVVNSNWYADDDHEITIIKTMNGNIQLFFTKKSLIGYIEVIDRPHEGKLPIKNYYIHNTKGDTNNG